MDDLGSSNKQMLVSSRRFQSSAKFNDYQILEFEKQLQRIVPVSFVQFVFEVSPPASTDFLESGMERRNDVFTD